MKNKYIINDVEARLVRYMQGLDYGFDLPEITDLKKLEYIVLTIDYSEYVQKCFDIRVRPKDIDNFVKICNIIFNAELYNTKVGSPIFYMSDDEEIVESIVESISVLNDGTVICKVKGNNDKLMAGDFYKSTKRWNDN